MYKIVHANWVTLPDHLSQRACVYSLRLVVLHLISTQLNVAQKKQTPYKER